MELGNEFLKRCEAAKHAGYPLQDRVGALVGRGFADVGCEVFLVLPGGKILSLLTGEKTNYQEADKAHYFSVPDVDAVLYELESRGFRIEEVSREDARDWHLKIKTPDDKSHIYEGARLLECLLDAYTEGTGVTGGNKLAAVPL